jgi:hypothetical protein
MSVAKSIGGTQQLGLGPDSPQLNLRSDVYFINEDRITGFR